MITTASTEKQLLASGLGEVVQRLRSLAIRAMGRMYRPQERLFAFRLRKDTEGVILEGVSRRYTAIALIGLAGEAEDVVTAILAGQEPLDVCEGLLDEVEEFEDLGEVALTVWSARALGHPNVSKAINHLKRMEPAGGSWPTVELAWSLTALVVNGIDTTDMALAEAIAQRLLCSFRRQSGLFPHRPVGAHSSLLRSHVTCFADFVYPIQALSYYHQATGNAGAMDVACQCAERMCELQGPEGQWWWHYDVRTGRVVERFPVYAVHQDSMAPMAMFALQAACGEDNSAAIENSLRWLINPPEIEGSLIDTEADIIWRKVARHEPGKLVRGLQATASRLHPALRMPGINIVFRPGWVDYESRPYHMAWILHAWPENRLAEFLEQ